MSSEDDFDAFTELVRQQKSKIALKYIDSPELRKIDSKLSKFIVDSDSDDSFVESSSDKSIDRPISRQSKIDIPLKKQSFSKRQNLFSTDNELPNKFSLPQQTTDDFASKTKESRDNLFFKQPIKPIGEYRQNDKNKSDRKLSENKSNEIKASSSIIPDNRIQSNSIDKPRLKTINEFLSENRHKIELAKTKIEKKITIENPIFSDSDSSDLNDSSDSIDYRKINHAKEDSKKTSKMNQQNKINNNGKVDFQSSNIDYSSDKENKKSKNIDRNNKNEKFDKINKTTNRDKIDRNQKINRQSSIIDDSLEKVTKKSQKIDLVNENEKFERINSTKKRDKIDGNQKINHESSNTDDSFGKLKEKSQKINKDRNRQSSIIDDSLEKVTKKSQKIDRINENEKFERINSTKKRNKIDGNQKINHESSNTDDSFGKLKEKSQKINKDRNCQSSIIDDSLEKKEQSKIKIEKNIKNKKINHESSNIDNSLEKENTKSKKIDQFNKNEKFKKIDGNPKINYKSSNGDDSSEENEQSKIINRNQKIDNQSSNIDDSLEKENKNESIDKRDISIFSNSLSDSDSDSKELSNSYRENSIFSNSLSDADSDSKELSNNYRKNETEKKSKKIDRQNKVNDENLLKYSRLRAIDDDSSHESETELSESDSSASGSESADFESDSDGSLVDLVTPVRRPMGHRLAQTVPSKKSIERFDFIASLLDNVDDNRRHLDAIEARKKFKTGKVALAHKIYEIYNEKVFSNQLPKDIKIIWSTTLRKTAGRCHCFRNRQNPDIRSIEIQLATKVITNTDRLLKTFVHEMCHGATWMIDKTNGKHGPLWRRWTVKAQNVFPSVPISTRCHNYKIHYKFEYWCLKCNLAVKRHSKSVDVTRQACGRCRGKFTLYRITQNGEKILVEDKELSNPNTFATFVKDNYSKYRKVGTTHADVMKKLSEEYKSLSKAPAAEDLSNMVQMMNLL